MMKYFVLAVLFTGAAALKAKPKGEQSVSFASESCRKDQRVTQLKVEDLQKRMLNFKAARPWMLMQVNNSVHKSLPLDFHVKRADAMCARAEIMHVSKDVTKEQVLAVRKKCLESKIAVAQAKKAATSLIQEPVKNGPINIKKVFYINLDKDGDRKKDMESKLQEAGLEYERVAAVTTDEIAKMPKTKDTPHELWQFSNQGTSEYMKWFPEKARQLTQAIYLSQARALKQISEQDNDSDDVYIIMEDDISLDKNWKETLVEKAKTLPKDWDVAKFVYKGMKRCEDKVPDSDWYEFRNPAMWTDKVNAMYSGNQAYMFRAKSIKNILEQLRGMPIMDIDGAMISNHQEKKSKVNGVETPSVWGMHTYALETPLGKDTQAKRK